MLDREVNKLMLKTKEELIKDIIDLNIYIINSRDLKTTDTDYECMYNDLLEEFNFLQETKEEYKRIAFEQREELDNLEIEIDTLKDELKELKRN